MDRRAKLKVLCGTKASHFESVPQFTCNLLSATYGGTSIMTMILTPVLSEKGPDSISSRLHKKISSKVTSFIFVGTKDHRAVAAIEFAK